MPTPINSSFREGRAYDINVVGLVDPVVAASDIVAAFSFSFRDVVTSPDASIFEVIFETTQQLNENDVHPGSVGFIFRGLAQAIDEFLAAVRKRLVVTSRRFWVPWDRTEKNFLWVGDPLVNVTIPNWLKVGQTGNLSNDQSPFVTPLELWGAEHLQVTVDDAENVDLTGDIDRNHEVLALDLPRNMEQVTRKSGLTPFEYYRPRRYEVKVGVRNHCGTVEVDEETGVTYPLKMRWLGADVGQTIATGSQSPYSELQHQPKMKMEGMGDIWNITPPLLQNKRTWIRLFAEHNAPPPYFMHAAGSPRLPLRGVITYEIRKVGSGMVVHSGTQGFGDFEKRRVILNEGVLSVTDPPQVVSPENYFNKVRDSGSFCITFIPDYEYGNASCEVVGHISFHEEDRIAYGIDNNPEPFRAEFQVGGEAKRRRLYLLKVEPKRDVPNPVNPLSWWELRILGAWSGSILPSVNIQVIFDERTSIGVNDSADNFLDRLESIRGDRYGIFIAVIDRELWDQLSESMTWSEDIGTIKGRGRYGARVGYALRDRNESYLGTAKRIVHEMGHGIDYKHVGPVPNCRTSYGNQEVKIYYYRPSALGGNRYPFGSCGEHLLIPAKSIFDWPDNQELSEIKYTPESNNDIMSYCPKRGVELWKCLDLLVKFWGE